MIVHRFKYSEIHLLGLVLVAVLSVSCQRVETVPGAAGAGLIDHVKSSGAEMSPLTLEVVDAVHFAEQQARATALEIASASQYTHGIVNGVWDAEEASYWTSGLLPGVYWLLYELTGSEDMLDEAKRRTAPIEAEKDNTTMHDMHFMVGIPFMAGYDVTGDAHYRDVTVTAAGSLATRFMPDIGVIDSWGGLWWVEPDAHYTIIDNMINLELLFWASGQPGGDPAWFDMAVSHASKSVEAFICPNGSTTHVIEWNQDGTVKERQRDCTVYPDDWVFARGTGWAIYGYAMTYRFTEMDTFLEPFDRMVRFFFENCDEGVPYWSFTKPGIPPNDTLDSSASALVLSGLFEMSQLHPDAGKRSEYWELAVQLLARLISPDFLGDGPGNGILYHASNGIKSRKDTALIFGDYYLLEAIKRYLQIVESTN